MHRAGVCHAAFASQFALAIRPKRTGGRLRLPRGRARAVENIVGGGHGIYDYCGVVLLLGPVDSGVGCSIDDGCGIVGGNDRFAGSRVGQIRLVAT